MKTRVSLKYFMSYCVYLRLHPTRKNCRGGGLCIFLLEALSHKFRDSLAVNSSTIECLCVAVLKKNSNSIVFNLTYRLLNGDPIELENHFKNIFFITENFQQGIILGWRIFFSLTLMERKRFKVE